MFLQGFQSTFVILRKSSKHPSRDKHLKRYSNRPDEIDKDKKRLRLHVRATLRKGIKVTERKARTRLGSVDDKPRAETLGLANFTMTVLKENPYIFS